MRKYKLINNITGWLVFAIAAFVYLSTMEPTASFWDCGEFISSSYKLEVGHPPGAPFFLIIGRFFSLFASGKESVAIMINSLSALFSGFTIMFLFWSITHLAHKLIVKDEEYSTGNMVAIFGAGIVGALAYTFSDTFWFSATEGEVYATSSLFTALVFWAILKWENVAHEKYANRWLVFIMYLMGLSIGVHLLNLLVIPAIVFVYYFKHFTVSKKGILLALFTSLALISMIMWGIIPGLVTIASKFELLFVNHFGLPYNSGVLFYFIALIGIIVAGLFLTQKETKNPILIATLTGLTVFLAGTQSLGLAIFLGIIVFLIVYFYINEKSVLINTIFLCYAVLIIGYSSFALIIIRSNANPPMDQNNPETFFRLLRYLNREQYGDRPLFYGESFNAKIEGNESKKGSFYQKDGKYIPTPPKADYQFDPKYESFFPRMYSRENHHINDYIKWAGLKESKLYNVRKDRKGNVIKDKTGKVLYDRNSPKAPPSFKANLKFFFKYQIGYMYMRYFMWNFVGRQNDIQGHGEPHKGNWISGIGFIDNARLGDQTNLPAEYKNNKAHNKYYFLPLILGLLGLAFQFKKSKEDFSIVALLFIFTGIAIVVYLNQYPHQPRERDYAFAGSFYAFAIWIGLGVLWIYEILKKTSNPILSAGIATLASLVLVPGIMAKENWDDHDRSGRFTARDFASNYLESCAPNAIIFTNGDNDTFPLWYAQEVEGIRTDVRVINLSYLSADWYIEQMLKKVYESKPVPFSLKKEQFIQGTLDYAQIENRLNKPINLAAAFDFLTSKEDNTKKLPLSYLQSKYGSYSTQLVNDRIDYFPSNQFEIPVDTAKIMKMGFVPKDKKILSNVIWQLPNGKRILYKNHIMVLDLLAHFNWDRPIYFAITVSNDNYLGLEEYFSQEGLAYRIVPYKNKDRYGYIGGINTEKMYDNMMNKFKWGGIDNPKVYLDENNLRMMSNIRSNFGRLAQTLIDEGKPDSARLALNKVMKLLPPEIVPHNLSSMSLANSFYSLGDTTTANEIVTTLLEQEANNLEYYLSIDKKYAKDVHDDARVSFMYILRGLAHYTRMNNQIELSDRIRDVIMQFQEEYIARYPNDV